MELTVNNVDDIYWISRSPVKGTFHSSAMIQSIYVVVYDKLNIAGANIGIKHAGELTNKG